MKRKLRDDEEEKQLLFSPSQILNSKEEDYFSPSTSLSIFSPSGYNGLESRTKRHNSFHQNHSPTSPTLSPGIPFPPNSTRRLKPLDYLTSRQTSSANSFSQQLQSKSSFTRRFSTSDNIHPNTLPPLGISFVSRDQLVKNDLQNTIPLTQPNITSMPFDHRRRLQSLPTLDSFEASIMETLPFDNKSEQSR